MLHSHWTIIAVIFLLAALGTAGADQGAVQTICIDPGHPSESGRGTMGRHLTEIDAAWDAAILLKHDLEADGFHVVMTKDRAEEFVTNERRAEIANESHASLLIRLHCDADAGTGIATYAPDRQGIVNGVRGPSKQVIQESSIALSAFHAALINSLNGLLADRGMFADTSTRIGGKQGALTGSIYSKVPVLLVEMCVLTNPHDEAIMSSPAGQSKIAAAMAAGVKAATTAVEKSPS
jgi:N-acetylmuramoyl-L-alanine amidase